MEGIQETIRKMDQLMKLDHMIVDSGGEAYLFSSASSDVAIHGYVQSIQNLFPEIPQSFNGLIVNLCTLERGERRYRSLKLNPKNGTISVEFFNDPNASWLIENEMYQIEMELTLAKMWRMGLSDETKSEILNVYKGIKKIH